MFTYSTVSLSNFTTRVMGRHSAWRLFCTFPTYKRKAAIGMSKQWIKERKKAIFHDCILQICLQINYLESQTLHLRFADGSVRKARVALHVLVCDGLEAAEMTLCKVSNCPRCTTPVEHLSNPEYKFQLRSSTEVCKTKLSFLMSNVSS